MGISACLVWSGLLVIECLPSSVGEYGCAVGGIASVIAEPLDHQC
jgi:hypothetical protein